MLKRLLVFGLIVFFLAPAVSRANEISVRPFLVDKVMVPRESTTEILKLSSSYDQRKAIIFATVNEISVDTEGEIREFVSPVMTDRKTTITSWIEISRGRIELLPGEEIEIPLTINVHPYAEPGEYHAFVGFVETKKRNDAERIALAGDAKGVIVKITIADERVDSMRVASLQVDRFITDPDSQKVRVTVENPGELESAPAGELVFYNSRGIEIGSAPVNTEGVKIQPGEQKSFDVAVPFDNDVGRFKANLNLRYGAKQQANLYDTTTFFMVPVWYLIAFGVGLLSLIGIFTVLFRRALSTTAPSEHGDEVALYVRDGHNRDPQHHDIDLSQRS